MAGLQTQSKTIDGITYNVTQLPAGLGLPVFSRVLNLLGHATQNEAQPGKESLPANEAEFWGLLSKALSDPKLYDHLSTFCTTFAKHTEVCLPNGQKPTLSDVFDLHFAGKYASMMRWLFFCFQVNFADSFLAVLGGSADSTVKAQSASSSPS